MSSPTSSSSSPLLAAQGLGRQDPRTGQWLLRDASVTLAAGDRLALAGPSGAGKTLLLRSLALLDPLAAGAVLWRGAPVAAEAVPRFRAEVIYLHQRAALFDGTVEDNLARPFQLAAHRGRAFDRARAEAWLGRFGRGPDFLRKTARELSGGEAQITAIVRALGLDPTVLLLDEPMTALDPTAGEALAGVVDAWMIERERDRACVWVGHDQTYVARVTTRRVVVAGGTTQAS